MTEYSEIRDSRLQSRIRIRYAAEIAALQQIGFSQLAFKLERRGAFSASSNLLIIPLMRKAGEVLVFPFPLRLGAANVLLVHPEPPTIADCMGMGVKFFTTFSDGALVVSSTVPSHVDLQNSSVGDRHLQIIRTRPEKNIEDAWLSHKRRITELESNGKSVCGTQSFADYVEISMREEADLQSRLTTMQFANQA